MTTAECPAQADGDGSSPDNPIELEDFHDLLGSSIDWNYRNSEEGARNQGEDSPDLNCKWVKLSGYFRHIGYQHYRGVLAENARDFYFEGGRGNFIRPRNYFVENWADESTSSVLLNGATLAVVGQFYDLCRAIRIAEKEAGEEFFFFSGPCHYGDLTGIMLRDLRVVEVKNPNQRILGEVNRAVIGDLERLPRSWTDFEAVHRTAKEWVRLVRSGADRYYLERYGSKGETVSDKRKSAFLERSLNDKDDWIWFLAEAPSSPVMRRGRPLENQSFAVFEIMNYRRGINHDGVNAVFACFCTKRTCEGDWPFMSDDTEYVFDPFVCVRLSRDSSHPTEWRW